MKAMSRHAVQLFDNIPNTATNTTIFTTTFVHPTKSTLPSPTSSPPPPTTHLATTLLSLYANHQSFPDAPSSSVPSPTPPFPLSPPSFTCPQNSISSTELYISSPSCYPDAYLVPTAIKTCGGLLAVNPGKQVHGFVLTSGLAFYSFIMYLLIQMYVKVGLLNDGQLMFDKMPALDVVACSALVAGYASRGIVKETKLMFCRMKELGIVQNWFTWNGMIVGFNQSGCNLEAVLMFREMHLNGFRPDGTAVSSVVSVVGDLEWFDTGVQIHGCVIKQGLGSDNCVVSSLIDMYGKCGQTEEMCQILDEMEEMDVGACNALVAGLARTL